MSQSETKTLWDSGGRWPSQEQTCVSFNGDGAKKTFLTLYPFTQGTATAIVAERTNNGETIISTENIFCRVYTASLSDDLAEAVQTLENMSAPKFECGYFVASDGTLSPCSDPM